jgi:hypothetical protein
MEIRNERVGETLKIYMDGHLHLAVDANMIAGVHSYYCSSRFCVDLFLVTEHTIRLSYADKDKWYEILDIINSITTNE